MSAELKKEIENIDFDLSELSSLELLAKRPLVKTLLATESARLKHKKTDLLKQLKELSVAETADKPIGVSTGAHNQSTPLGTVVVTNYMWDQTDDFVKIYIEIDKNCLIDSTQIAQTFANKRSFSIIFGKYKFTISKLFADIDSEKSYNKVSKSGNKLIIYLKKSEKKQWNSINEVENRYKQALDKSEDKEDVLGAEGDSQAGLMKLMKQMYDEGDDDMKRTIAKSWYESRNKNAGDLDMKSDSMDI